MKDVKTTLAGLVAGLPIALQAVLEAYNAGQFTGKNGVQVALGIGLILLGVFAKDFTTPTATK